MKRLPGKRLLKLFKDSFTSYRRLCTVLNVRYRVDRPGDVSKECLEDVIETLIHQVIGMDKDIHALVLRLAALKRIPPDEMERYLEMDKTIGG